MEDTRAPVIISGTGSCCKECFEFGRDLRLRIESFAYDSLIESIRIASVGRA